MAFDVVRVVQGREKEGVIIASGFKSEVDALRYAAQQDYEYVQSLQCKERQFPFTYHYHKKRKI